MIDTVVKTHTDDPLDNLLQVVEPAECLESNELPKSNSDFSELTESKENVNLNGTTSGEETNPNDEKMTDFSDACASRHAVADALCPVKPVTETTNERTLLSNLNIPTLKREKSITDTIERKKKKVKFNPEEDNDEVLVSTRVFEEISPLEALIEGSNIVSNAPLACKLKRLLQSKSKETENQSKTTEDVSESYEELSVVSSVDEKEFAFIDDDEGDEYNAPNEAEKIPDFPVSKKREGTFTLDDTPPPKTMKPSTSVDDLCDDENNSIVDHEPKEDRAVASEGRSILENLIIENKLELVNAEKDGPVGGHECKQKEEKDIKKLRFANQSGVNERIGANVPNEKSDPWIKSSNANSVEIKFNSLASKRRAKVNVEKRINSIGENAKEETDNREFINDRTKSPSFKVSAKKTLMNAWKSAIKGTLGNENSNKSTENDEKLVIERRAKTKSTNLNNLSEEKSLTMKEKENISDKAKIADPLKKSSTDSKAKQGSSNSFAQFAQSKGVIPKTSKIKPFHQNPEIKKENSASKLEKKPLVGTVVPFRRDGTFTKWSRQFDCEKARMEAEVRRLSADRERLQREVASCREWAEGEGSARKAMRREHLQRVRRVKDEETKKRDLALADIKNRLEEEHRDALAQQKTTLARAAEVQFQKLEREQQEELRKLRQETKAEADKIRTECKRDNQRSEGRPHAAGGASGGREKAAAELAQLRQARQRLEDQVQVLQERCRELAAEVRQCEAAHESSASEAAKLARQDQAKMMDELRARDRAICQLEREAAQLAVRRTADTGRPKLTDKTEETRKPLSRSNSSPAHQNNKNSKNNTAAASKNSNGRNNSTKQQQQRDESIATEAAESMEALRCASEVARLREEVDQQKRTIRQLTLRAPRDYHDHQPMSLGTLPCMSMDSVYDGLLRPLNTRRQDSTSSSDWSSLISDLREENRNLKSELQEARDQSDLLEFRILELTEGSDRFSESEEVRGSEQRAESPHNGTQEDLSLPLSIDSGLDLTADCKRVRPSTNTKQTTSTSAGVNHTTNANNDTLTSTTTMSPTTDATMTADAVTSTTKHESGSTDLLSSSSSSSGVEDGNHDDESDKMSGDFASSELTKLAARLQEALANPKLQEDALIEAITKLRSLDSSLNGLHTRVSSLTDENQYLQDALSALSDSHETRTEASGTESEIVMNNRKTPSSLHSDLSDSESDSASSSSSSSGGGHNRGKKRLEVTTSFQESGIFEGEGPCQVASVAVQTDMASDQQRGAEEDLCTAVARLASIRSAVQGGGVHMRLQESDDYLKSALENLSKPALEQQPGLHSNSSEQHELELTSLRGEVERARQDRQQLQAAYDLLSDNIAQETDRRSLMSCRRCYESLEVDKGEARALREQLRVSESSRRMLYDEKCELEEAENDARLMVQRLDSQLTAAREMECLLSASLSQEQEISRELHRKVKDLQAMEKERYLRQGILERQSLSSVERMANLVMDRDSYASQLSFVRNGLLLVQVYKCFHYHHRLSNAPGSSSLVLAYSSSGGGCPTAAAMVDVFDDERNIESRSSYCSSSSTRGRSSSSSCGLVDCAIDEALMEMSDDSVVTVGGGTSSISFLDRSTVVDIPSDMDYSNDVFSIDDMIDSKSDKYSLMNLSKNAADFLIANSVCDTGMKATPVRFCDDDLQNKSSIMTPAIEVADFEEEVTHLKDSFVMSAVSTVSNVTFIDVQTSQVVEPDLVKTHHRAPVSTRTRSTMTVHEDLLSQRERYYLEQIQGLQDQKMNLRKDQEQERLESLEQQQMLESGLEQLREQLEHSERARSALLCELEEGRGERETAARELQRRVEKMRGDMARCSDLHEEEKRALRRDYDAKLSELSDDRRRHLARVTDLEHQLEALRQELEVVGVAIVSDMTGYDRQPVSVASTTAPDKDGGGSSRALIGSAGGGSELLDKIRQLIKSESALRQKVADLESKESAYIETIEGADEIMNMHLKEYKIRIEELEAMNDLSTSRIQLLERSEDRLRSSMQSNGRSEQDSRVAELLQQLINTEKSELEFKAKLWGLEKNEKQLQIKLMEGEKAMQGVRGELREQEELLSKMAALQGENNTLAHHLQKAHEGVRRICEVQQSEHVLKGRVEELETSEQALKEALDHAEAFQQQRERRLMDQVASLEEEVLSFRSQVESASLRESEARETEISLRRQLEQLKLRLQECERDLKESSSETINYEYQHRSEVCKMRSQLKLSNSQLTELDGISCSLRERLAAAEQLRENLERQLEERKRRHESDLLQLNLQVSQGESRLEETEGQLCVLTQLHAAEELDMLASAALAPVLRAAHSMAADLKLCDACAGTQGEGVRELRTQLRTLTDLLHGASDDAEDGSDEDDVLETEKAAENSSCFESPATFSPSPAQRKGDADGDGQPGSSNRLSPTNQSITVAYSSPDNSLNSSSNLSSPGSSMVAVAQSSNHSPMSNSESFSTTGDESNPGRAGSPVPVPAPRRKRKQLKREEGGGGAAAGVVVNLRGSFRAANRKIGNTTILEELEEKVRELEECTTRKEEELRLADSEAAELNSRLHASQQQTQAKDVEVGEVRRALSALQEQLVLSIEAHEYTKIALESKYKAGEQSLVTRVHALTLQLERLAERGRLKDHIIATLVMQIRAILRSTGMGVVITQIRQVGSRLERRQQQQQQQQVHEEQMEASEQQCRTEEQLSEDEEQDFDIEAVCELLGQPAEAAQD